MKKYVTFPLFILIILLSEAGYGQYVSHYTEKDKIKIDTLLDRREGCKFIIDKERIYITAIDKDGKLLWRTDPAIDNKIEKYRNERPTIVYFTFGPSDKGRRKNEVIWISYSNTQFGYIDKKNGNFTFQGQD